MPSTKSSGLRYVRDRCVNAYWMLRTGKFKLIFKSIYIELAHRAQVLQNMLTRPKPLDDSQVPGSAFINRRKVLPRSYRPTVAQPPLPVPLRADPKVIAGDLKRILSTLSIEDSVNP
jgi:hypothetical protein